MLFKIEYILLAIILFIIMSICLVSPVDYVPYTANNLFKSVSEYEGFGSMSSQTLESPIKGFAGVQGSATNNESSIDIFSSVKGDISCPPNPYSNSKGYLCIGTSGLPYDMLTTRGGNQTRT